MGLFTNKLHPDKIANDRQDVMPKLPKACPKRMTKCLVYSFVNYNPLWVMPRIQIELDTNFDACGNNRGTKGGEKKLLAGFLCEFTTAKKSPSV